VLYFQVFDPAGDQLWRTGDGGQTVRLALKLAPGELLGGLAFGASAGVLYVGSHNPFPAAGAPGGHLHVSRDGGASWQPAIASGPTGPRYRCLAHAGDRLYACGAGEVLGDAFLVGVSTDEGRSWQPHTRLEQVTGARACTAARCLTTVTWLCQLHGRCAPDAGASGPDAPAEDAGTARAGGGGCACTLATRPGGPGLGLLLVLVLLGLSRWRGRASPGGGRARRGREPFRPGSRSRRSVASRTAAIRRARGP
jgi:hypothetical protein